LNAKENVERIKKPARVTCSLPRHSWSSQGFSDPKVVVMVIVVANAGLLVLMPVSRALAIPKT
jgi:hypothetical protein